MNTESYDLKILAAQLAEQFPHITGLYLFGSRRHRTKSPRSDVDVLVRHSSHIRPNDLRLFSDQYCPALDLFLIEGGKATSCSNESSIEAESFEELVESVDAVKFWSRDQGILDVDIDWNFSIPVGIEFPPTAVMMPDAFSFRWVGSIKRYFRHLESEGLPTCPYIGASPLEIAKYFKELITRIVEESAKISPRGKGIEVKLLSEYDFQNLFFLSVKPWLPSLGKEEVTITYDGQRKTADFNLFKNQIVIEMKHITNANTMALVAKTLEGLGSFYKLNGNIRVLLFAVLVNNDVELDDARWESDFSSENASTAVMTVVVRQPSN